MKKFLKNRFFLLLIFFSWSFIAQNSVVPGNSIFTREKDIFGTRNFIENKGQFENPVDKKENVLFLYEQGDEKIYFTAKGLIYEQVKRVSLTEEEREKEERGEIPQNEPKRYYVNMNWVNPALNVTIEKSEKQQHYFTYGSPDLNSYPYKKITYKNIYKNIDIEYSIPSDKETGIKYNIILHPGADVKAVKAFYQGDVQKIRKNRLGEIIIKTKLADIIEHTPIAFYTDHSQVESEFSLKQDTIMFVFPNGYAPAKTVVIDPWVTMLTTSSPTNSAYDVDYDFAGNTFIYGGGALGKIAKYNPSGVLQWIFSGFLVTPSWSSPGFASNFAVDKFSGKSYVGQVIIGSGSQAIRLDIAGNYDNFMTVANNVFCETWDMGFHCPTGEVFIFGGSVPSNLSGGMINQTNGAVNFSSFHPLDNNCCHDIVSHAIDDQGLIFVLYASNSSTVSNKICLINSTFNGNVWTQPSGYLAMNETINKNAYQPGSPGSNGFNCLAVNSNYIYYYDGQHLAAYSKVTGLNTASLTIPGMTLKRQGGIAVDDCNNIYIGGGGSIRTYNFNGTSFNAFTPIPLGIGTPTTGVYDIKLDRVSNILYVCGAGFVGTYSAILSTTCISGPLPVSATSASMCAGNSVTLTASGAGSYLWSDGSTTSTISVAPLVTTIYTVTGNYNNLCGSATGSALAVVTVVPPPNVTVSGSLTLCTGDNGVLTATGANSYSWNTGATNQTIAVTPTTTTSYTVTGTSSGSGCTMQKVVTVTVNPLPVVTVSGTLMICKGDTRVLTAAGANSYSWNTGATNQTIAVTPTTTTTYTVVGTNSLGCSTQEVATVTVDVCKGIVENIVESTIARIYPNPTHDKLNIELLEPTSKNTELSIYNSLGQLIYFTKKLNFDHRGICSIDLEATPDGLYFVYLVTDHARQSVRLVRE